MGESSLSGIFSSEKIARGGDIDDHGSVIVGNLALVNESAYWV